MHRRLRIVLPLLVLAAGASAVRAADGPELSLDGRQFPGAPVVVTSMTTFQVSGSHPHRGVCVSFRVHADQALTAVKFAVSSVDEQGREAQRMTIAREGSFLPSVIVAGNPRVDRRSCVDMDAERSDAPIVAIRLVAATYADGTTWTAPATELPPLYARGTPPPLSAQTGTPAKWSPTAHAGYLAVGYGRDKARIAIFAPGATVPSTTIALGSCCVTALAFDAGGTLYAATSGDGVAVIAPGASSPARKLPASGAALALDAAGDVAVGGESGVHVYPSGAETGSYVLPGHVPAGGLAANAAGELAVADPEATKVAIYAHAASTPARSVPLAPGPVLVGYDPNGHLAVANLSARTLTQYQPRAGVERTEIRGPQLRSFAFDAQGRLLIGTLTGIQPWGPGDAGPQKLLKGPAADVIAVGRDGTIAAGDGVAGVVVLYRPDETQTVLGGLEAVRALAVSP